ncbi:sugar transferase [Enterococcus sp. DIV0660C]|uniref:sugar transferase n=1 Tax=Enterococcus sp. DIV0660C TaxID=2230880 RepID=UPI001A8E0895|nr:sugar transferase [Enterococcus sp. DIV0660C]MBO0432029.1 sugar transferase [Enterococcus sp. DIV0660C]
MDYFELVFQKRTITDFLGAEKKSSKFRLTKRYYLVIKRFFDIVFSITSLLLLSPLLLVISLLIYFDQHGPIFFTQERVGKNGKIFKIYKFRTMVVNAEELLSNLLSKNEMDGPMFKMKDDPRVTRIGRYLRKLSLDELPQLYNVIKGDMSLVGPRPPLVSEVKKYTKSDLERLTILPGCSGIWQVCGRNTIDFTTMVKMDLWYKNNQCLLLDSLIILKTIKNIIFFKDSHAY